LGCFGAAGQGRLAEELHDRDTSGGQNDKLEGHGSGHRLQPAEAVIDDGMHQTSTARHCVAVLICALGWTTDDSTTRPAQPILREQHCGCNDVDRNLDRLRMGNTTVGTPSQRRP